MSDARPLIFCTAVPGRCAVSERSRQLPLCGTVGGPEGCAFGGLDCLCGVVGWPRCDTLVVDSMLFVCGSGPVCRGCAPAASRSLYFDLPFAIHYSEVVTDVAEIIRPAALGLS